MEELVEVINELQNAFSKLRVREDDLNLNLPRIAVVGSQSSGKSSVLEALVGRDFLPRGSGIVTRCPLVLQLVHAPPGAQEVGQFGHRPEKMYTDFSEIRQEIVARTQALAGEMVVCETPIMLKITSPHVLTLTLIDLPGLVTNAIKGQPESIVSQIHNMVHNFVAPENTIILAVSSANEDIANSRALDMSRKVDREGKRTIGVLTKLDLMDQGTDAMDTLSGKLIRLRHGFIGVVNRSQKEINSNTPMDEARIKEREFFARHPIYGPFADKMGTQYLAKRLNALLMVHIQECIPALKQHVDNLMKNARKKQEQLGMTGEAGSEPSTQLLQLITRYTDAVNRTLTGDVLEQPTSEGLVGGSRIDFIFHESFGPYVLSLKAAPQLADDYIRLMVRTCGGLQSSLFPSDQVLRALTKQQIRRLEDPCLRCVGYVHDELAKIVESSASTLERFPVLKTKAVEIMQELLQNYRTPCVNHVKTVIAAEEGYINFKHPAMQDALLRVTFMALDPHAQQVAAQAQAAQQTVQVARDAASPSGTQPQLRGTGAPHHPQSPAPAMPVVPVPPRASSHLPAVFEVPEQIMLSSHMTSKESQDNCSIREMVEAYFSICKQTVSDQVPKTVNLLMIQKLRDDMYNKLIQRLFKESLFDELLAESPEVAQQRKATEHMLRCLQVAQDVLAKVRDHPLRRAV